MLVQGCCLGASLFYFSILLQGMISTSTQVICASYTTLFLLKLLNIQLNATKAAGFNPSAVKILHPVSHGTEYD